ncbi:MAG: hypothetical protein H0T91_10495 [Propionibacteriaceae bacterium]|nr:hypothetical protein [Propionibacteriaceae bacterium]
MTSVELTKDPLWVPESCTLPTREQPLRVAEFDELFRTGVTDLQRTGTTSLRLTLVPEPEVAATAAALAARESRCCGFFTFTLTVSPLELHLTVGVPPARVDVLDALAQRAPVGW